uniref:CSP7 n=1 Tax=Helicoverpa armigera TaxID=29058 RepID=H6TDY0_HELAM|nr:CSP7 [Helicoverpa armigera]
MKVFVVLSVLIAFTAAASLTPAELDLAEAFDYEALFSNDEQRKLVFDCILGKGECGDYQKMAEISRKVLESKCADCNPKQKAKYETVLKTIQTKYEPFYNELLKNVAAKKE